jgi:hypothetical protein
VKSGEVPMSFRRDGSSKKERLEMSWEHSKIYHQTAIEDEGITEALLKICRLNEDLGELRRLL